MVRRKHMAIFGATGAGKAALLRNMVAWDTRCGPLTPPSDLLHFNQRPSTLKD